MNGSEHAKLAKAYLESLCTRLDRREKLSRSAQAWWLAVPAAVGLSLGAADCGGTVEESGASLDKETACSDNKDNDGDGKIDCLDPDCKTATECAVSTLYGVPSDGGQDAQKPDAQQPDALPTKETACNDQVDNDGDGQTDCLDNDCAQACSPPPYMAPFESECANGLDDDYDQQADCKDPDCQSSAQEQCGKCLNGFDDDQDGKTDCDDTGCQSAATETCDECFDNVDNDKDGKKDCDDPDCEPWCINAPAYAAPF